MNCALTLCTGLMGLNAQAAPKPVPVIEHKEDSVITDLLVSNQGAFSPELRAAFLKRSKDSVLKKLGAQGKSIDKDLLAWVDEDPVAYDAVYGTVYPADPEILLNLNVLWKEQGASFTKKYKQLSIGAAVARRGMGVDSLPQFQKWGGMAQLMAEAKEAKMPFRDYMYKRDKEQYEQKFTNGKAPSSDADKKAYAAVRQYIKSNKISILDAFGDDKTNEKLSKMLRSHGSKRKLFTCLSYLLTVDGSRPERRSHYPKVSEYFKHLAKINSIPASELPLEEGQRWPLFPIETAPWPLLSPLSRTMPMDEVQYVWDKFLGKVDKDGKRRYHTYGPYRRGDKLRKAMFQDLPWHKDAWPALIKQGGLCGTMSSISMGTSMGLGKPSFKAGQPKHSCIVGYSYAGKGKFISGVGQSVAGPLLTGTSWIFGDAADWGARGYNAGAVHHFGLAQSMNVGLDKYVSSRIALHIYRMLSNEKKATLGRKLLFSALEINPFNTELWYTLAHDATKAEDLINVFTTMKKSLANGERLESKVYGRADEAIVEDESLTKKTPAQNAAEFLHHAKQRMISRAFAHTDKFSKADQKIILEYLSRMSSKNKEVALAVDRFYTAVNGPSKFIKEVEQLVTTIIENDPNSGGRKKKKMAANAIKKAEKELTGRLKQLTEVYSNRKTREQWLWKQLDRFPEAKTIKTTKKGGKIKMSNSYLSVFKALESSIKEQPVDKKAVSKLKQIKSVIASHAKEGSSTEKAEDTTKGKKSKKEKKEKKSKNEK